MAGPAAPDHTAVMDAFRCLLLLLLLALPAGQALSAPGDIDVRWTAGAADCEANRPPPLQVHTWDRDTFILRQDPCVHFEANFLYLLVGDDRALLIDSGAVAEPARMPLADTVRGLLQRDGRPMLPLVVAHTHGHGDHRAGDAQLASLPSTQVVPTDTEGMRAFFGFDAWPDGVATIDLGDRIIDVFPAPGHHPDHVLFHDRRNALLFTGDFLLPGRLLVDDLAAYRESAGRVAAFFGDRAVRHVLGGHVELDARGDAYPHGATHHPDERPLPLSRADLMALPAALADFNGFHARHASFIVVDPMHMLAALAAVVVLLAGLLGWGLVRFVRRRRRAVR